MSDADRVQQLQAAYLEQLLVLQRQVADLLRERNQHAQHAQAAAEEQMNKYKTKYKELKAQLREPEPPEAPTAAVEPAAAQAEQWCLPASQADLPAGFAGELLEEDEGYEESEEEEEPLSPTAPGSHSPEHKSEKRNELQATLKEPTARREPVAVQALQADQTRRGRLSALQADIPEGAKRAALETKDGLKRSRDRSPSASQSLPRWPVAQRRRSTSPRRSRRSERSRSRSVQRLSKAERRRAERAMRDQTAQTAVPKQRPWRQRVPVTLPPRQRPPLPPKPPAPVPPWRQNRRP